MAELNGIRRTAGEWLRRICPRWVTPPRDLAVRQGAWLFTAAGVLGVVTDLIPGQAGYQKPASLALDSSDLFFGLLLWCFLGGRLSRRAAFVLAPAALSVVATSNAIGAVPSATLGVWFILVYVWVGSWFPRGTSLWLTPLAVAAYLLPMQFGAPISTDATGAVILIVPVGILAAEAIAKNTRAAELAVQERQIAVEQLERANLTDDLTGLGNRRAGNQMLDSLVPGDAVAVLDLDHFKKVNDAYGHARGDEVLHQLGAVLISSTRSSDTTARMGGEEFLIVLRDVTVDDVRQLLGRIADEWRCRQPLTTLSLGAARHSEGRTPMATFREADEALYAAKQRGRNRVVVVDNGVLSESAA